MAAEPTNATIPFLDMEVDLTDPGQLFAVAISLIAGFTLFNMSDSIGSYMASRVNSALSTVIGFNPGTGESNEGADGV
jgi:hypothetical protein